MPEPPAGRTRRMLASVLVRRLALAAAAGVPAATYLLTGLGGLLLLLTLATAVAVVAAAAAVPGAPPSTPAPPRPVAAPNAAFRTFRQAAERLSWAGVSPRHYDVVTRPQLQRLMVSRLAQRHGVDVRSSPEEARRLVGEDVWELLDPARPASGDSQPPGLDHHRLRRLVDRLEAL